MSSQSLKYGHIIRIKSNDNRTYSYITSKSYTDPKLYFQTYGYEDLESRCDVSNYRESLFEILPTSSFEINDEMNGMKNQTKKAQSLPRAKTQQQQFKTIIEQKKGKSIFFGDKVVFRHLDSKHYIYGSFECAQSGIGAFKIQLRQQLSEKLIFQLLSYRTYEKDGDQISIDAPLKIYHSQTQCYLSFCMEDIFLDRPTQIQKQIDYKAQRYQPHIAPFLKLFHTINPDQKQIIYQTKNQDSQAKQKSKQRYPDQSSRYQIINQNIAKRIWKFQPYLSVQLKTNKQIIRDHDIVYLLHTKDDKYLSPNNFNQRIFLNKRIGATDPQNIFDGLWQIQQRTQLNEDNEITLNKSRMPNKKNLSNLLTGTYNPNHSMSMSFRKTIAPFVQKKQEQKEAETKKSKSYSLRHLMSGRILYFFQNGKENFQIQLLKQETYLNQKKNDIKRGYLLLQCLDSALADGTLTRLSIDNGKAYLQVKPKQIQEDDDKKQDEMKIQQFTQLKPEVLNELKPKFLKKQGESQIQKVYNSNFQKQQLQPTKDASEHGFRVYKVDEHIKQIALKIMSSQEVLFKFTGFIGEYSSQDKSIVNILNMSLLNNVINVIKDLIGFIFGCDYNKIISSGNSPNSLRQRAFDQLGMVELITQLLNKIFERDEILRQIQAKTSQYKKIRTIYVLGYEVLQSMAAYNNMLKIKISKYLNIYLNHILVPQNRVVYKSIQEILDGNQLALQHEVKQSYISTLIQTFGQGQQTTDPADLQFLSKLCLCKNRTVQKNQYQIFTSFYENEKNNKNKFFFKADHGKYQIASKISKKLDIRLRTLPQLYSQCQLSQMDGVLDPSKGHWNYFMQYLNLLADVCVGRNSSPLGYITLSLPLKTLIQFLNQKLIRNQLLHQPFIRLIHHAFVQTQIYKQISRITKVKNWNTLGNQSQIPKPNSQVTKQLQSIKELITQYIKKINLQPLQQSPRKKRSIQQPEPTSITFSPQDMPSLNNVNTFLQILKSTLVLGFWPRMNEIKMLVPYMLKILAFDIEYARKATKNPKFVGELVYVSENDLKTKVYRKVKQQLRLNKPNIVLLVQCKILAAQILDIIIDFQFNIRVESITNHFRKVQQQQVDLRQYPYDEWKFKQKWRNDKQFNLFAPQNEKEGYLMNQKLWIHQIQQTIQRGDVFKYCYEQNINYLLVLFEAFIYGNQELTDIILKILFRVTSERKGLLNTFKDIILVAGGNLNKLTSRVVKTRGSLLKLTNPQVLRQTFSNNNLWNKLLGLDPLYQKRQLGTIQQLAFLTMAMKKGQNPTQAKASRFYEMHQLYPFKEFSVDFQKKYEDKSYLIITQKEQNNPLNQNLIKSQDHHLLILIFIRLTQKVTRQEQKFFMVALHAAYNFLTVLVWNNIENKNQLQPFLAVTQNHLAINVGCIDFFQQMYKNNKRLVIKTDVTRIVNKIIQLANELDFCQYYHKSKLLDFLRNIIIFDNKGVTKNQNIVMEIISQYQVSDNNQIVYLPISSDGISLTIEQNYKLWIKQYEKHYDDSLRTYCDLQISPQLLYIATFFQIFSGLIQNQNKVNIGKCTNMHPHNFLVKIISHYKNCWPVIRHLRSYINKLYYMSHQKQTQLFVDFVKDDLGNIEQQMKDILILITTAPDYNTIKIKNPIRYTYLGSYAFLTLQECLHSLDLMFSNKEFQRFILLDLSQQGPYSERNYHKLLFIMQMIQYLMKTINGRYINKYLAKVVKHIKNAVSQAPLKVVQNYILAQKQQKTHQYSSGQDSLFRKNYVFHDSKGFWRHLIDWNAHHEQQNLRQRNINALAKKTDKQIGGGGGAPDAQQKKKRDYLIQKLCLANIQKLFLIKEPQRRKGIDNNKQQKGEDYEAKNQQKNIEQNQDMLPKNLVTSQSQRFKVKNQRFDNPQVKNMVINSRRKKLVKFIEVNPAFAKFAKQQTQNKLYQGFASLSETSIEKYGLQVVGKSDVIKTLVQMNKKDPKSIKIQYKVQIVKMLTSFIQKQSPIFKQSIEKWIITDTTEKQNVKAAQDYLNDCNCSQFLCSLFQNDLNTSINYSNQILMFGICLLFGKNDKVQRKVLQIMKKDEKNIILLQLRQLIKKNQLNTQLFNFSSMSTQFIEPNYSDTYDFYNDDQKIMERKFNYIPQTVLQQKQFEDKMVFLQRIFIFLKVLCEGSNQQIKNFIRQQTSDEQKKVKTQSINFIGLSAVQLKRLLLDFKIQIIKVPYAIVDFIYQVTQIPCVNNQLFLCNNTSYFHDFAQLQRNIMIYIREKRIQKEHIKMLSDFFAKNIKNCISCLQGNHQQIRNSLIADDLPSYYVQTLELFLKQLAEQQWNFKTPDQLQIQMSKTDVFKGKILDLFDVVTVIVKLKPKYNAFQQSIMRLLQRAKIKEYFSIFQNNLLGIQINMDSGQADSDLRQIQYFPRHSVYNYLSRATRITIMEQINRSTQRDKIIGLINTTPVIKQQIDYNFILDHDFKVLGIPVSISATKIGIYQTIALSFSILICFLMLFLVNVVYYPYDEAIQYELGSYKNVIKLLSSIQFAFALIYTTLWVINHNKLALGKYDLQMQNQLKKNQEEAKKPTLLDYLFKIPKVKNLYCLIVYDSQFSGIFLFFIGSALGTLYRPEWFAILIISIMMSNMDVLKNMIASITTKIKILGMLSLLGTAFIGIFSIFSINYYVQSLYESQLPKQHCMTVVDCIVQLYIKEQIGSQMESFQTGRFFFDMIYTIFMELLFGNIVSGVLIDTFTQLREKRQQIRKDKQGMCFICGITKQILQKKNEDIKTHYRFHYHKLWNYVFYIYNLRLKRQKVGLEYIIWQKINNEDVSWVPVEGGDEEDIGEKIQDLQNAIIQQKKFIDQIEAAQ